jgi:hypothetical protein
MLGSAPGEVWSALDHDGDQGTMQGKRLASTPKWSVYGANRPSRANEALFSRAVEEVAQAAERLVRGWVTSAPPKDRDVEIRKHIEKSRIRFGKEPKRTPIDPIR